MQISVEISLYPLDQEYIPVIQDFIDRLKAHRQLNVLVNTMSTQIFGNYSEVLQILAQEMQTTHRHCPKAPFVIKVLNGDLSPN